MNKTIITIILLSLVLITACASETADLSDDITDNAQQQSETTELAEQQTKQCYPSDCCHATVCSLEQPDCTGAICTMDCRPGTLDCGQGECNYNEETDKCDVVWTQDTELQQQQVETKTITHKDFKLNIPKDWTEKEFAQDVFYQYFSPTSKQSDPFTESINLIITFLSADNQYTLESLFDKAITDSKASNPDFELLQPYSNTKLGNADAIRFKFSAKINNKQMTYIQIYAIENNMIYAITYSCPDECQYYAAFNEMINSFEVIQS